MTLPELTTQPHFDLFLWCNILISGAASLWVLYYPREPRSMIAWILAFLLLPILGVVLFIMIGEPRLRRLRRRRQKRRARLSAPSLEPPSPDWQHSATWGQLTPSMGQAAKLVAGLTQHSPQPCNHIVIHEEGGAAFAELEQMLAGAQHHIHMEFYLFRGDVSGQRIGKILSERAAAGVEVRLLLDFIGSWGFSLGFFHRLKASGVEIGWFMPIIPWRGRWRMNFRNHRKIVVIDGSQAMTGSQNIGDEYAGRDLRLGTWQDAQARIGGPIVGELQDIFLEDWHYATGREPKGQAYHPPAEGPSASSPASCGKALVQLIPSGPDHQVQVIQLVVHSLFAAAQREICVATPYFIPDASLLLALYSAAYRGVRVRLLVPGRSDHLLSLWAGRSYYREICAAGVEVSEYPKGMLHSKLVIVDGNWAMLGSANMDERSFRLNFEAGLLLYDHALARQLHRSFEQRSDESRRFTRKNPPHWGFGESLLLGVARLAGPLL